LVRIIDGGNNDRQLRQRVQRSVDNGDSYFPARCATKVNLMVAMFV
jgi:hypothetical protein